MTESKETKPPTAQIKSKSKFEYRLLIHKLEAHRVEYPHCTWILGSLRTIKSFDLVEFDSHLIKLAQEITKERREENRKK